MAISHFTADKSNGVTSAPIPPLALTNHAYARHDNVRDILYNNQPTMGECDGSLAFWLDLIEITGKFVVLQSLSYCNQFLLTQFAYFYYCYFSAEEYTVRSHYHGK